MKRCRIWTRRRQGRCRDTGLERAQRQAGEGVGYLVGGQWEQVATRSKNVKLVPFDIYPNYVNDDKSWKDNIVVVKENEYMEEFIRPVGADAPTLVEQLMSEVISIYQSNDGDILLGLNNGASLTRFALIQEDDIKVSTGYTSYPLELMPITPVTNSFTEQTEEDNNYQKEISGIIPLSGDGRPLFVSIFNNGDANIRVDLLDSKYTEPPISFLNHFIVTYLIRTNGYHQNPGQKTLILILTYQKYMLIFLTKNLI